MDDHVGTRDVRTRTSARRNTLLRPIRFALRADEGQGLVEYSMILAFISAVAIAALSFMGADITMFLSSLASQL
jgi:Flp pilus assembly pilin Flp